MIGLEYIWAVPLLPLIGSLLCALSRHSKKMVTLFALGTTGLSFLIAIVAFVNLLGLAANDRIHESILFNWIEAGSFVAEFGIQLDPLSATWMLMVTGVGFLIHLYSVGYMAKEDGYYRYFSFLNLFMFSMLILVLANNYLLMFIGWEGVGLCSYLLIGYYYETDSAPEAGKKAFVMNRVGDFAFIIAIIAIFGLTGSIDYNQVMTYATQNPALLQETLLFGLTGATFITLLLFIGATGKSAQIPLFTWLPDAMEGPTPVSALIHAATMVTAGIYMLARSAPLFELAPITMIIVAITGGVTALFAATIGMWQYDIKRVLAYSTVSQLGYMFLACGIGAYMAAVFHVMTHAFFKAALFLSSGSVIHGMSGEQDIRKMGGLRKKMPITHASFLISTLAIAGIPPMAGFFSKDEILLELFLGQTEGHLIYWAMATFASAITAFYMFRLYYLTFAGENRTEDETVKDAIHESPATMTIPLVVLAFLAITGGLLGLPINKNWHAISNFLAPLFVTGAETEGHHISVAMEFAFMGASVTVAIIGIAIARFFYLTHLPKAISLAKRGGPLNFIYWIVQKKYFIDELYNIFIVEPLNWLYDNLFYKIFDVKVIDGFVNNVARFFLTTASILRESQTGLLRNYAAVMMAGTFLLIVLWVYS
ncbi:MAG: NADH-quinone oxidoreductase subunit L [Nitrospinota bacterium]